MEQNEDSGAADLVDRPQYEAVAYRSRVLGGSRAAEAGRRVSAATLGIDLKNLHDVVQRWFAGRPVYSELKHAVLPPATYTILWLFLGWLALTPARWLWAVTTVAALGWLAYLIVQQSGADTPLERVFAMLMLLSMNATGVTVGNGQLIVHLLPALLTGLLLLQREGCGWHEDLLAAALLLVTLVKPSVSLPFFWIVLFSPRPLRSVLLITLGYLALTLLAAQFQEPELWTLLQGWLVHGSAEAVEGGVRKLADLGRRF
ncbi:MAG: hypothetical protein AMJ93_16555 [Anaerolineae bacterium SM23_84]|nr:MAG: hypothetical protein AMJ93_16555 [Anaerolineae bacterium SM23_84]